MLTSQSSLSSRRTSSVFIIVECNSRFNVFIFIYWPFLWFFCCFFNVVFLFSHPLLLFFFVYSQLCFFPCSSVRYSTTTTRDNSQPSQPSHTEITASSTRTGCNNLRSQWDTPWENRNAGIKAGRRWPPPQPPPPDNSSGQNIEIGVAKDSVCCRVVVKQWYVLVIKKQGTTKSNVFEA